MNPNQDRVESFEELCKHEQRFFDENLADVEFLVLRKSYVQAANRFAEFRHHFEEHIRMEELIVLPLFARCTGDRKGAGKRILEEHRGLAALVDGIATSISQWDFACFTQRVAGLRAAMKVHVAEEARLYPGLGEALCTAADWRLLCFKAGVSS